MKFFKGDLVLDSRKRAGVVVNFFKTAFGFFYIVLIDEKLESLSEEELTRKDQ